MISGAIRFGLLGVLAFLVWAAPIPLSTTGLYSLIAAVFLIGSGLLLYPLFEGERRILTCYKIFLPGFLLYAVIWCAAWFGIRGTEGENYGAVFGLAAFTWVIHQFYLKDAARPFLVSWSVFFLCHTLGYTLGAIFSYSSYGKGVLAPIMEGQAFMGKLLWGLFYGMGFGAGLGFVLQKAKKEIP